MNLTAKVVPFSSVVGSSVTLHNESGAVVCQLALLNTGPMKDDPANPDEWKRRQISFAEEIAGRINATTPLPEDIAAVVERLRDCASPDWAKQIAKLETAYTDKDGEWDIKGWMLVIRALLGDCLEAADIITSLAGRLDAAERAREKWEQHATTGDAVLARTKERITALEASLAAYRTALERIIATDRRTKRTLVEFDPAGSTYDVEDVDGPAAAIAREALARSTPGGAT